MVHPTWSKPIPLPTAHRVPLAPMAGQRRWSRPWRGATDEPGESHYLGRVPRTPRTGTPRAKFWTRPWRPSPKAFDWASRAYRGGEVELYRELRSPCHRTRAARRRLGRRPQFSTFRRVDSGDKIRMEMLGRNPGAFIRPSPSGGNLGGVARRTRRPRTFAKPPDLTS